MAERGIYFGISKVLDGKNYKTIFKHGEVSARCVPKMLTPLYKQRRLASSENIVNMTTGNLITEKIWHYSVGFLAYGNAFLECQRYPYLLFDEGY